MTEVIDKDNVKARECRFAVYCPPPPGSRNDYHFVKEIVHTKDGRTIPTSRGLHNFKRPFWITAKNARNHQQKKETELKSKLMEYKSTQTELVWAINAALEQTYRNDDKPNLRKTCRNPYVYGADIKSTAVIKRMYQDKFPDVNTPYSVACSDTETNVFTKEQGIIMDTISFKDRVYTAVLAEFVAGYSDVKNRLQAMLRKHLGKYVDERKIVWEIDIVDNEGEIVKRVLQKAHEWKPDFFAMWNIDFDIPKMVKALERSGMSLAEAFSDPSVPQEFKFFEYKQGPKQKKTSSGKIMPKPPHEQWHTVYTPASFYVVDAMCAYKQIRISDPAEAAYSLDYILGLKLGLGKLRFDNPEFENVGHGLQWHQIMQSKYQLEYIIYNVFDCISMELLDEQTKDLAVVMPLLGGSSDFVDFKSQPRRLVDELHYFVQTVDPPRIMGTTSDQMTDEIDDHTVSGEDWIIMLPAHLLADNGLQCIMENPRMRTALRRNVADLDVSASYPNGGAVMNMARNTTVKELISIEGVSDYTRRMQGINLSGGATNAVEICCNLFAMPTLVEMADAFAQEEVDRIVA